MAVAGGGGEIAGSERNLTRRVAAHYDELSGYYVDLWGEHIHHGYYPRGDETRNEATRALIKMLLRDIELRSGAAVLDVGCGVGGTSRLLASEHGCRVVGVTLSRVQARMAADTSAGARPPRYVAADATALPLTASFDAILAVEVLSHVVDRGAFFRKLRGYWAVAGASASPRGSKPTI